jgi:tRNA(adenine34) deaminase
VAIRDAAAATGDWHLTDATLVVTLEPCVMCAGAILAARIPRVVFGAWDEKAGAVGSVYDVLRDRRLNHQVEVVAGIQADACSTLLLDFFEARR